MEEKIKAFIKIIIIILIIIYISKIKIIGNGERIATLPHKIICCPV